MPALLFVSYSGCFGGAERVLIDCLDAVGRDRLLACPEGPLAERARAGGTRVLPLAQRPLKLRGGVTGPLLAGARLGAHARELRGLILDIEPDLTVAWGMRSAIACALAGRGRPFLFSHHDFLPGRLVGGLVRAAASRAGAVIACSTAVAEDLDPRGRLGARLRIVHPGVDLEVFEPAAWPTGEPEVLVLGALADWKRPDLALEICARARATVPGLRLRLVGAPLTRGDPVEGRLRRRAAFSDLAGAVELAGAHADPRPDLARATCLLHCASREPFGIVLVEALASGRPVLAPDGGGPREILDDSCGLLYSPADADAGAAALRALLGDPVRARAMGAAGRERARAHFDRTSTRAGFAAAVAPLRRPRALGSLPAAQLALVTVTHNSERELEALMDSVEAHLAGARLIVVDCDSRDASVTAARARPGVQVLELGENLGFGRACNRGLRQVGAAVTAFVNPDVELVDESLLELAGEALRPDRPERLFAPLVLHSDGTRQDSAHPVPASAADLIRSLVPPALVPGAAGTILAPWRSRAPRRVGWAVGATLLARTSTLRRLGPFDESIFMYGEDLELGLRAAQAGVPTWFWPAARVVHHSAHSTHSAFGGEPYERLARARHDAVARRLGPRRARLDDRAQAVTFASRLGLKHALGLRADRERLQLGAVRALHERP